MLTHEPFEITLYLYQTRMDAIKPANKTYYEISDSVLRYSLATYCFLAMVLALLGNTIVLFASMKHKAIKLDRVSVVLIRNIAIADVAYAFCVILQVGLSLLTNTWPYGDGQNTLCHLSTYLQHMLAYADINLICAFNIARFTCILFPLNALLRSFKMGVTVSTLVWFISNLPPLQALNRSVYFDYRSYRCAYKYTSDLWVWLEPVNISVFLVLPTAIIFVTTLGLLYYVRRITGVHKQAVLTLVPVSIVFFLSYAPIGGYFVAEYWIYQAALPQPHLDPLYTGLFRYGMLVKFVNNTANPVIYFFTIQSFRSFIMKRIFRLD